MRKVSSTHEADNFAINCSWVYLIGYWWLYGRKWPLAPPPPNEEIRTPFIIQKVPKKFEILPAPSYKTHKKNLAPHTKKYLLVGGIYTMENNNTNTDYHIFVSVRDQKSQFPSKIPIWPKSLLYKRSEKWISPTPHSSPRGGGGEGGGRAGYNTKYLNVII